MSALAGGPSGNPISMVMSAMGGAGGGHMMGGGAGGGPMMGGGPGGGAVATAGGFSGSHGSTGTHTANQCVGTKLCMEGCSGQYELGPVGADGCQSCSCKTGIINKWASTRDKPVFGICEQQRCRPACASEQSDQRLHYSFIGK